MKIIIKKKRIKNLILKINDDGDLLISAPYGIRKEYIEAFIKQKQEWINKARERVLNKKNNISKLEDNDQIIIFNIPYSLNIRLDKKERCEIIDKQLILFTKENTYERKKKIFDKFIKGLLKEIICDLTAKLSEQTNIYCNDIKIRDMKTRWGSCNVHTKNITYNLKLYSKPVEAIEYVVMHELAHILYPHHQPSFWNFVEKYIPDYKERKKLLKYGGQNE